jgi:ActD protein
MRKGTLFEFSSPEQILSAADALRAMGFTRLEAYTPYAIPELEEKLAIRRTRIPRAVLAAASFGCALAFGIMWFTNASDYPLNVGGRPLDSIPAHIPIMFETTVLFGSLTAFLLVLLASGLPRLHHPVFEVDGIESASIDRFWLGIDEPLPPDDVVRTRMAELGARAIRSMGARP